MTPLLTSVLLVPTRRGVVGTGGTGSIGTLERARARPEVDSASIAVCERVRLRVRSRSTCPPDVSTDGVGKSTSSSRRTDFRGVDGVLIISSGRA